MGNGFGGDPKRRFARRPDFAPNHSANVSRPLNRDQRRADPPPLGQ